MHFSITGQERKQCDTRLSWEDKNLVSIEPLLRERPSAPRRRTQILEAAEQCFRLHGFHAASMSQIAAEAKMSAGLIYRYFASKESIIAAIVERDVRQTVLQADAVQADQAGIFPAMFDQVRAQVRQRSDKAECALFLEVMAEAARNPKAAKLVGDARRRIADRLCALVAAAAPGRWSESEVATKVDLLLILLDSVAFKTVADPSFDCEKTADQLVGYAARIFEQDERPPQI
jgi:TetR/AcrR family transcriptional repressor of uid operon